MHKVLVEKNQCDWCNMLFDTEEQALLHEKTIHKCPNCKHGWYLYGSEFNCELKDCKFEKKEDLKK